MIDWAAVGIALCIGLFFLVVEDFSRRHGLTPKEELTVVTGPATEVTMTRVTQGNGLVTDFLHFTVDGQTTEYGSDSPGYPRLLEVIRNGNDLTIGVSTKRETLFPRSGWVPLYSASVGSEPILTYEETVRTSYRSSHAALILAGAFLLIGGWGLRVCIRNRNVPLEGKPDSLTI
jgi:hypothetical protein